MLQNIFLSSYNGIKHVSYSKQMLDGHQSQFMHRSFSVHLFFSTFTSRNRKKLPFCEKTVLKKIAESLRMSPAPPPVCTSSTTPAAKSTSLLENSPQDF